MTQGRRLHLPGGASGKKLFININGIHPCIHCPPARDPVPEQHRCWLLLRQRHRLDGLCALRHLPHRPGVQGWCQLLRSGRPVHHPDCHHRLHDCEDCGLQRDHPRPQHPAARLRGHPLKWTQGSESLDLSGQAAARIICCGSGCGTAAAAVASAALRYQWNPHRANIAIII